MGTFHLLFIRNADKTTKNIHKIRLRPLSFRFWMLKYLTEVFRVKNINYNATNLKSANGVPEQHT